MSYIRSWALGGDGIIFHRLSFSFFFNRTRFWYNCTPKKSFLLWKKESIRTIIPQESDPGWAKSAGNKHQQKPTSLIYEDSSGFTLALLPQAKIPEASAGWAKASCVEETHISQPKKERNKKCPPVPGLLHINPSLPHFYTCLVFPVWSLSWERKLFLLPAVYETFSRHSFGAACRCSSFACQLPQRVKATPWMLWLLGNALKKSCP